MAGTSELRAKFRQALACARGSLLRAWASLARLDKLKLIPRGACFSLPAGRQPGLGPRATKGDEARPAMFFNRAVPFGVSVEFCKYLFGLRGAGNVSIGPMTRGAGNNLKATWVVGLRKG
jgi:hypothetical protein